MLVKIAIGAALFLVVLLAAVFVSFKLYRIPSAAMEPTLRCAEPNPGCSGESSDRMLALRFLFRKEPDRGDIVAFRAPPQLRKVCGAGGAFMLPPGAAVIKRVIGLPGEVVTSRNGVISIDGRRLDEPYLGTDRRSSDEGRWAVPEDAYFVLGDNRVASCDSRSWGFLPRENLSSRAVFRYWPPSRIGPVD